MIFLRYLSYYCQSYYINSIFLIFKFRIDYLYTYLFKSIVTYYSNYLVNNFHFSSYWNYFKSLNNFNWFINHNYNQNFQNKFFNLPFYSLIFQYRYLLRFHCMTYIRSMIYLYYLVHHQSQENYQNYFDHTFYFTYLIIFLINKDHQLSLISFLLIFVFFKIHSTFQSLNFIILHFCFINFLFLEFFHFLISLKYLIWNSYLILNFFLQFIEYSILYSSHITLHFINDENSNPFIFIIF